MNRDRIYLRCGICTNVVMAIRHSGDSKMCCDETMSLIDTDASRAQTDGKSPPQSKMADENYNDWITLTQGSGNLTQRISLESTGALLRSTPIINRSPRITPAVTGIGYHPRRPRRILPV